MGAYEYTALDHAGRERRGVLEGDTPRQVRQSLRDQGLTPLEIDEVSERGRGFRFQLTLGRGLSTSDLALVTRQLATLIRAAMPLEEALLAVAQQSDKRRVQTVLLGVRARVMEGYSLAAGLGEFPRVFPELYRSTIAAGEHSGHLESVLERLADYTENRQQGRQQALLVLIYPVLLTTIALAIALGLVTFVIPQVAETFEARNQTLPLLTRVLIAFSDFLRAGWPYLVMAVIAAIVGSTLLLRQPEPRRRFHRFLLRVPLVSRLVRGENAARFARTLSILAGSGVPVLEAMRIASQVVTNIPMKTAVDEATRKVREGGAISRSLAESGLFPAMTIHLIGSGEQSGQLETMLERAADNQEREVRTLVETFMAMLQPLVILLMGGLVMTIVLAILLPIFELNQLIG